MPLIKKSVALALDWNSFPAPSPEAEKWTPDPDSIARPGGLKDPRFNKDPQAEEKKAALKREMRLHGYRSPSASTATSINGAAVSRPAVSSWPVQASRSFGLPTAPLISSPIPTTCTAIKPATDISTTIGIPEAPKTSPIPNSTRKVTKDTMEDLPIMAMGSAKVINKPIRAVSPEKSSLPAWAGPLEKALAEDTVKAPHSSGGAASKAVPSSTQRHQQLSNGGLRPLLAARYKPLSLDAQFEQAYESTRRVSDPISVEPHLNGVSSGETGQRSAAAQSLLENGVQHTHTIATATCTSSGLNRSLYKDVESHLKLEMILIMESDLLRERLARFTADELDDHLAIVYPIHDRWFQGTYGGKHPEGSSQQGDSSGNNLSGDAI